MAKKLNPQQDLAADTTSGRILVLAGAGSGKTSVLIERITRLILDHHVPSASILGLTFTNKAAKEMRERLKKRVGSEASNAITLSTFHSFCHHILRQEIQHLGFTQKFSIYDDTDMKRIIRLSAKAVLKEGQELPPYEHLLQGLQTPKPEEATFFGNLKQEVLVTLKAYNAVNFDQLLHHTLELFRSREDILHKYQTRYQYILVDEYQDTNKEQFELIELLSKHHGNLFVVGDDDQAIYGWRGADVRNILQFPYDQIIKLEQNYRSTPNILSCANAVIAHNSSRHEKTLHSDKPAGDLVHVFHGGNEQEEADGVVKRIISLKQECGLKWKDIAIIFRSNKLARPFEMALLGALWKSEEGYKRSIPYQVVQGYEFYERAEVKDFFSYLKFLNNPKDQEALLRIINYPKRGISTNCLANLTSYQRENKRHLLDLLYDIAENQLDLQLSTKAIQGINQFIDLFEKAQEKLSSGLHATAKWLVEEIQLKDAISLDVKSEQAQEFKWENVQQCLTLLEEYEKESPNANLQEFLSSTILDAERLSQLGRKKSNDCVQLMTMHSAKGLEFEACFLVGLQDHILPHEKSQASGTIEEERRLFYVGITRAKRFLTLSMCRKFTSRGKEIPANPSRFLFELPKDLLKVSSWNLPSPYEDSIPVESF